MARLAGSAKLLRAMNESAALGHLLDNGALTRNDLRELTGLSKPTTSEVLRRLTEAGLAVATGHTTGGPGPNAEIYAANPEAAYAVAVSVRESTGTGRPALGMPVGVDNDVNLAAVAERRRGVAGGADSFALLWFGEGVGLAIDLGGTLLRGASGGAGEIGYVPLGMSRSPNLRPDLHDIV